jgi:hypothetical protein
MAQFRATIQGNRGEASRLGSKDSGINSSTNGWDIGGDVTIRYEPGQDRDVVRMFLTGGSNHGHCHELIKADDRNGFDVQWNNVRFFIRRTLVRGLGDELYNEPIDKPTLHAFQDVLSLSKLMVHKGFVHLTRRGIDMLSQFRDIKVKGSDLFWPVHARMAPDEIKKVNKRLAFWALKVRLVDLPMDGTDSIIIADRCGFVQIDDSGYPMWDFAAAYMLAGFLPPYALTNGPVEALAHQFNKPYHRMFVNWIIDGWVETFLEMMARYGNGFHKVRLIRDAVDNMLPEPKKED